MESRRKAREAALQALYMCDSLGMWDQTELDFFLEIFHPETPQTEKQSENLEFWRKVSYGVLSLKDDIDAKISSSSTRWSLTRMNRVDRNILRVSVFELLCCPDIPKNVTINEAIEIAKRFGSDDSPMFINGVLDSVAGDIPSGETSSGE